MEKTGSPGTTLLKVGMEIIINDPMNCHTRSYNKGDKVKLVKADKYMDTDRFFDSTGYAYIDSFVDRGWISPATTN